MREMNILQKEDLPYFEELEKQGKAVILRFDSLDGLMDYNLEDLLKDGEREPNLNEIEKWISEQKEIIQKKGDGVLRAEKHISDVEKQLTLLQRLQGCSLPPEDKALVSRAINLRIPYDQVLELLEPEIAYEQRREVIRTFEADKNKIQ